MPLKSPKTNFAKTKELGISFDERLMNHSMEKCMEKLRILRPDDNIAGFDAWDEILVRKKRLSAEEKTFIDEMTSMMKTLVCSDVKASVRALRRRTRNGLSAKESLLHYLVILNNYIENFVSNQLGEPRLFHKRLKVQFSMLWDLELLETFSPDQMLLIHWSFAVSYINRNQFPRFPEKLLEIFIKNQTLLPHCFRRWYYAVSPKIRNTVKLPPDDSRRCFSDEPKGDFDRYLYLAKPPLPNALQEAIRQDSPAALDINLTLMNKKWSAGIFGYACECNAVNIIRHFAGKLKPDGKAFSSYDCVIHTILYPVKKRRCNLWTSAVFRGGITAL